MTDGLFAFLPRKWSPDKPSPSSARFQEFINPSGSPPARVLLLPRANCSISAALGRRRMLGEGTGRAFVLGPGWGSESMGIAGTAGISWRFRPGRPTPLSSDLQNNASRGDCG